MTNTNLGFKFKNIEHSELESWKKNWRNKQMFRIFENKCYDRRSVKVLSIQLDGNKVYKLENWNFKLPKWNFVLANVLVIAILFIISLLRVTKSYFKFFNFYDKKKITINKNQITWLKNGRLILWKKIAQYNYEMTHLSNQLKKKHVIFYITTAQI